MSLAKSGATIKFTAHSELSRATVERIRDAIAQEGISVDDVPGIRFGVSFRIEI